MTWQKISKACRAERLGRWIALAGILLLAWSVLPAPPAAALDAEGKWTGPRIMKEVFKRHELYPYIFEEQTMILMDHAGNRDVRRVRRFSRVEKDGTVKYLLVFDDPEEVRGVALLAVRHPSGESESGIYLPALGKRLNSQVGNTRGGNFLGTDFAIEDLAAEIMTDFRYVRKPDQKIQDTTYFVVDAFPQDKEIERTTGYSLRRHFVRKDIFFIVRTDYYDRRGRLFKRQTYHDLRRVNGDMWRANMILMENFKEHHKTLLKIDRRVFSHDYVTPEMFTTAWLLEDRHIKTLAKRPVQRESPFPEKPEELPP